AAIAAETAAAAGRSGVTGNRAAGAADRLVVDKRHVLQRRAGPGRDAQPAAEPGAAAGARAAGTALGDGVLDRQVFQRDAAAVDEKAPLAAAAVDRLRRGVAGAVGAFDRDRDACRQVQRQEVGGQADRAGDV